MTGTGHTTRTEPVSQPNLSARTPREIDAELYRLYIAEADAKNRVAREVTNLHRALGERPRRDRGQMYWPTTDTQAVAAVTTKAAAGELMGPMYSHRPRPYADKLAAYAAAVETLAAVKVQAAPLNAEFTRRGGWSRYFLVQQHNGHYHLDMNCQTCNNGREATRFVWNPEMSGMTEADAFTELGRRAATLCSVCFPNAPAELRHDPDARGASECSGSRKPPKPGTAKRWGRHTVAACTGECGDDQIVTAAGVTRKHVCASR